MQREPTRFEFRARPVISPLAPWVVYDEPVYDRGVARDILRALRLPAEPCVLRVTATPRKVAHHLAGDWLCDAAVADEPQRIPSPVWAAMDEARWWARRRPWLDVWETCPRADWMLARCPGVDFRLGVRAGCACVRSVLSLVPPSEGRPAALVDAVEAWSADSSRPAAEVRRRIQGAYAFRDEIFADEAQPPTAIRSVVDSVIDLGFAVTDSSWGRVAVATASAATARAAATGATARDRNRSLPDARRIMADLVRAHIPTLVVLRAAVRNDPTVERP